MSLAADAVKRFIERFEKRPHTVVFAPGRVEVLGNHTDYNGGYVLPAAIRQGVVMVGRRIPGDVAEVHSDYGRKASFSVTSRRPSFAEHWGNYVIGVVDQLTKARVPVGAFEAVIASDLPSGAGLSSSAALEVATALLIRSLYPYSMGEMQIAQLCQRAENQFVGVNCGIMDQFSSLFGKEGSLLFLDCQTLEHETIKMGRDDLDMVICSSGVKHALTGGDYNIRRAECMAAAAHFGKTLLREVTWDEFVARETELPEEQRKRARHILTENARVLALRDAIAGTDVQAIADILYAGHASCRDLFENTTPELDALVDIAAELPGCCGARMTGGGWGGATLNLVTRDAVESFSRELSARYKESTGIDAKVLLTGAGAGARVLGLEDQL